MLVILFSSLPKSYFRPSQPHTQEFSLFFLPVSFSVIFFLFYGKSFLHNDSIAKRLSLASFSPRRPLFSGGTRYGKITFRPRLEMDLTTTIESEKKSEGNIFFFNHANQLIKRWVHGAPYIAVRRKLAQFMMISAAANLKVILHFGVKLLHFQFL